MKNFVAIFFVLLALAGATSCKKTSEMAISEPITIVTPDSNFIRLLPGRDQPLDIRFTTDRPIQFVKGMYEIDSVEIPGHVYTFPDTLFYTILDSVGVTTKVNKYQYTGTFHVPDTLLGEEIIRFRISMQAKNDAASSTINYQKEFKIGVK
ncbi:MAG: hypothetical protein U0T73_06670 [Chitinophagales bacterium]